MSYTHLMHRESILIALGALIAVSPYLGLPYAWLMFVLPVLGLLVLATGLSMRMRRRAQEKEAVHPNETHSSI